MKVDKSLGSVGFNAGAGLDLVLFSNIALNIEGVYFSGKTTREPWRLAAGTYAGHLFSDISWNVDQAYMDKVAAQITPLEVKTSFFQVLAGLKILF